MNLRDLPLDRLQLWMQAAVVHPGTAREAVAAPPAAGLVPPDRVEEIIRPTDRLTGVERVGIYQGMYLLRMEEALESDYPGLQHLLGPRRFFALVREYVQVHPSVSYSLNRLGDFFPDFVGRAEGLPRRAFCHDLARLELAVAQVFDGEESPVLASEAIARVPEDAWERARLRTVSAFRLLALDYPVNAYLQSVRDEDHRHPPRRRGKSYVAVYRRDYAVYRLDLTHSAHKLLEALAGGVALGDAVGAAVAMRGRRAPKADDLFRWFRQWVAAGLFQAVDVLPPAENR
jgi:hypothetical protein